MRKAARRQKSQPLGTFLAAEGLVNMGSQPLPVGIYNRSTADAKPVQVSDATA
jgi:hypothetical protein